MDPRKNGYLKMKSVTFMEALKTTKLMELQYIDGGCLSRMTGNKQ